MENKSEYTKTLIERLDNKLAEIQNAGRYDLIERLINSVFNEIRFWDTESKINQPFSSLPQNK
jgi:hypothetical protein